MPTIGIVDDSEDVRRTFVDTLELALPNWTIIDTAPFAALEDYLFWISENEVSSLILDERLNEKYPKNKKGVNYEGHDLVDYIRQRMNNLPIFIVTTYYEEDKNELMRRFGSVEDIINRKNFNDLSDEYASRFARASERYLESIEQELSDISLFAEKIVRNDIITENEQRRIDAIREKVNLSLSIDELKSRQEWIIGLEKTFENFKALKLEIERYIRSKDNDTKNDMEESS